MSSTSSSEGDEPKDARMEVLFCMGDHKRVAWVPSGEKASVYEIAKRTFQEFEVKKFHLQVFHKSWEEWIDVDESHVVMDREKLKIVIGNHSFHEEPSNEHKRPKLSHLVESLRRNNANQGVARKPKPQIKLQIGWQHYNRNKRGYSQVKTQNGGGVAYVMLDRSSTFENVLDKARDLFFPCGISKHHGKAAEMQFNLANSRGQTLCSSDFSLSDIHLEGGSRAKVYLFSMFKTPSPARSEASSDLPDPELDTDFPVLPSEFLDFPSEVCNLPGPSHNQPSQSGTPTIAFKESQNRDTSCSICADRERENFFVPCGHSVCKQCAERILQEHQDCPFCKNTILKIGTLF